RRSPGALRIDGMREGLALQFRQLSTAGHGQPEHLVEQVAAERLALGGALDLHEAAVARADHGHVGLGGHVLLLAPVEPRLPRHWPPPRGPPARAPRPPPAGPPGPAGAAPPPPPPVIAAVRVPPSACSTSQSMVIELSPSALASTHARRDRPTRREISIVRP